MPIIGKTPSNHRWQEAAETQPQGGEALSRDELFELIFASQVRARCVCLSVCVVVPTVSWSIKHLKVHFHCLGTRNALLLLALFSGIDSMFAVTGIPHPILPIGFPIFASFFSIRSVGMNIGVAHE